MRTGWRFPKAALPLAGLALLVLAVGCTSGGSHGLGKARPPVQPDQGCVRSVPHSPFSYDGAPGAYRSGTPGLPTYGTAGSDFPSATSGVVLADGAKSYASYQLAPHTVYYLLPGTHVGSFQADAGDAFVGGLAHGVASTVTGNYSGLRTAFDSNFSAGNTPGVTIEYLTIEKFQPAGDAAAVNESSNTGWTLRYDTITLNVPGAGVIAGADNTLEYNCMTLNGQYGFQATDTGTWGRDSLTGGPYDITVKGNEISYNDTCDFEGLLTNPSIGWHNHDPVPAQDRNPHCGAVTGDGNQGGFKLWETNGVTVANNDIHNNWGPGAWVDTNNANTTFTGNRITANDAEAIIEEISYNFAITGNYLADNGWLIGRANPKFPTPAVYISESGSVAGPGGVPACGEPSCAGQPAYPSRSLISGNTLVDNGGGVFLWQNSDRHCASGIDHACTLVDGGASGGYTIASCQANLHSAALNTGSYTGEVTGSPARDWWDGCLWKTANVHVTGNVVDFRPAAIPDCVPSAWPDCGANGIFSEYSVAVPYTSPGGWAVASQLTFYQGDTWAGNVYNGPSTFYAWNQGSSANPVSWAEWTGSVTSGDECGSVGVHTSGACAGPFGQDAGSTYHRA